MSITIPVQTVAFKELFMYSCAAQLAHVGLGSLRPGCCHLFFFLMPLTHKPTHVCAAQRIMRNVILLDTSHLLASFYHCSCQNTHNAKKLSNQFSITTYDQYQLAFISFLICSYFRMVVNGETGFLTAKNSDKVTWHTAKYGDPYSEFVLYI